MERRTKRDHNTVRHDIGIPELESKHEYEILQLGIIIGTDSAMKACKMTADTTLKFIEKLKKEMEDDN